MIDVNVAVFSVNFCVPAFLPPPLSSSSFPHTHITHTPHLPSLTSFMRIEHAM